MARQKIKYECGSCGMKYTSPIKLKYPPVCTHDNGQRRALKPTEMTLKENDDNAAV